ncbi:hypothetical protein [Streptomyces sclerotialus]|uniref:hypothetical protein n=1 Tax=Streptomyces sclerotialus TaxID=1957 RepID=UPI0004C6958E
MKRLRATERQGVDRRQSPSDPAREALEVRVVENRAGPYRRTSPSPSLWAWSVAFARSAGSAAGGRASASASVRSDELGAGVRASVLWTLVSMVLPPVLVCIESRPHGFAV